MTYLHKLGESQFPSHVRYACVLPMAAGTPRPMPYFWQRRVARQGVWVGEGLRGCQGPAIHRRRVAEVWAPERHQGELGAHGAPSREHPVPCPLRSPKKLSRNYPMSMLTCWGASRLCLGIKGGRSDGEGAWGAAPQLAAPASPRPGRERCSECGERRKRCWAE